MRSDFFLLQSENVQQDGQIDGLGQVHIVAMSERGSPVDAFQTVEMVKNYLHPYGQLFAFMVLSTCQDGSVRAIAEFCNVNAAVTAVGSRRNNPVINVSFAEWTAQFDRAKRINELSDDRASMSRCRSIMLIQHPHPKLREHFGI